MKKMILCAGIAAWALSFCGAANAGVTTTSLPPIQPSDTGAGINGVIGNGYKHYVVAPSVETDRKNVLVVFLGGSTSKPGDYTDISDFVAGLGYGVIDLRYPNSEVVGTVCAISDDCFRNIRGETVFGEGQAYAANEPTYDSSLTSVNTANSIINRLVALLDYLSNQSGTPNPSNAYWAQFLTANSNSPYTGTHIGKAYPNWSKTVIAGHSQGGGHSAFIGTHLPSGTAVRRVVMLSAPNDHISSNSATWILENQSTPLNRFWALRNDNEGSLGSYLSANWATLGSGSSSGSAYSYGGVGGANQSSDTNVDTTIPSGTPHRLVITKPNLAASTNHNSTAANDVLNVYNNNREAAWQYMFTANGTD